MATFVLVHGAWHGGWCWKRVAPLLRAAGHEVYTPTLTGLGERAHLASPEIGLSTQVQDVVGVIETEDLRDVILVGHSYGGMVITGVAGRVADRIAHVVYLDAFVPDDGQSLIGVFGVPLEAALHVTNGLADVPPPPIGDFGVTDANDLAWIKAKMLPHPALCFTEGVKLPAPLEKLPFSRTYILAAGEGLASPPFVATRERLRGNADWRCYDMPTGHDIMVTMPRELSDILMEVAG